MELLTLVVGIVLLIEIAQIIGNLAHQADRQEDDDI